MRELDRSVKLTVKQLGSDDLLLYLTAYSVVHRGHLSPSFFTDLRLLIEKEPLHWPTLVEEASQRHLKIPLYHGLCQLTLRRTQQQKFLLP